METRKSKVVSYTWAVNPVFVVCLVNIYYLDRISAEQNILQNLCSNLVP